MKNKFYKEITYFITIWSTIILMRSVFRMGFDKQCILDIRSVAKHYFCPVCHTLVYLDEALQLQCTHLYCKPCLTHLLNNRRACPHDRYLVTEFSPISGLRPRSVGWVPSSFSSQSNLNVCPMPPQYAGDSSGGLHFGGLPPGLFNYQGQIIGLMSQGTQNPYAEFIPHYFDGRHPDFYFPTSESSGSHMAGLPHRRSLASYSSDISLNRFGSIEGGHGIFPSSQLGDMGEPLNVPMNSQPGFNGNMPSRGPSYCGIFNAGKAVSLDHSRKRKRWSMGWCCICKVDCGTVEGLEMHSQSREHQKATMDRVIIM